METTRIDQRTLPFGAYLREVYRYREMVVFLALRDLRIRFAQTVLGILWAFLAPLVMLGVYTLIFHEAANIQTEVAYPIFAMAGLSVWNYFAFVTGESGNSILQNQDLVQQAYFPRLVVPLSKAAVALVDFGIQLLLMVGLMLALGTSPGWNVFFVPILLVFVVISGLTAGIWLSALTFRYRDLQQLVPYILQIMFFMTPVVYPVTIIPERFDFLKYVNPMTGLVDGFRWCMFGQDLPSVYSLISVAALLVLLVAGIWYFRKVEHEIPDYV